MREAVREDDCGDVLVFMPGVYEIRKTVELLAGKPWMSGRDVFPFTGLWRRSSRIAPWSGGYPRVIVSTNVAETSLTIEGVRTVVDSGYPPVRMGSVPGDGYAASGEDFQGVRRSARRPCRARGSGALFPAVE